MYEIGIDGSGLRQLTDGPYDDLEPTYLPDGGIVFVSSRCHRWVNCWLTQVAILYRCDGDGSNIRPLSANKEHLERIGRFDMPHFRPREEYLREMVRYGVLAPDYPREGPLDPYELDRRYWESLWYRPSPPPEP